jgi:CheY-like chemotaxis protein/HPt (histidine-containing phosphotransfer) domain-containing protein
VLYIEDSISDQELLKFFLKKLGTSVQTAPNGLVALDLAQQRKFDAVITDMWLPAMSGSEAAQALREMGYKGPIIALTADEREECHKEAIVRGCTCVLAKPCSFEKLAEVLSRHLPHRSSRPPEEPELVSELWGDVQIRPLIRSFLKHLDTELAQIQQQLEGGKRDLLIQKLCLDIKGSSGGYGYSQVSSAAAELLDLLMSGATTELLKEQFQVLSELCRSALRGVEGEENRSDNGAASASSPGPGAPDGKQCEGPPSTCPPHPRR